MTLLSLAVVSAKINTKLIVAHVSVSAIKKWDVVFFLPAFMFVNRVLGLGISEPWLVRVHIALSVGNLCSYGFKLLLDISGYTGGGVFRARKVTSSKDS